MASKDPTSSPEPELHPSIQSTALIDSYTYFSCDPIISNASTSNSKKGKRKASELEDPETSKGKGKGKEILAVVEKVGGGETVSIPGQWMLGVDEAGRGPVLGLFFSSLSVCYKDKTE